MKRNMLADKYKNFAIRMFLDPETKKRVYIAIPMDVTCVYGTDDDLDQFQEEMDKLSPKESGAGVEELREKIKQILERKHPECFYKPTTFRVDKQVIIKQIMELVSQAVAQARAEEMKLIIETIKDMRKHEAENATYARNNIGYIRGVEILDQVKKYLSSLTVQDTGEEND